MVLVKNLSTTVINSLPNYGGEILYNTTANRPIVNTADGFKYFVLSTLSGDVSGLASLSATNLTGTLQTAAQPNVTSLGTLTGLTSSGNINFSSHDGSTAGLSLGGVLVTATAAELNYVDTTPGTAEANKALVTDSNNSIVGLTNLETDNLTVNGTLVTASAIELNYTDVTTIGIAQASKALVLDANLDIVGIHNIETDNLTVNGTLVTASAVELNYTDVSTIGTADPGKALVTDLNKDIGGIRNLSAENLTGTLQTAAQPNVTSVGTLTSLDVSGATSVGSLTVGGVSLTPYGESGIRARVYSTVDFNGRLIYNNIVNNVDFTDFVPSGQASGYSMEVWGYIKPVYTENYTFTITSNDQFRIWINNNLVRTGWTSGDHNNIQTDPIALTANVWYPIYIQHVQETSTERLNIKWESTSQIVQTIPQANFAFDNKDIDVSMRNSHFQDSIKFYDSTNSNVSSVGVTTSGVLTLSPYSNNVNLPGHDGSTTGLHLAGTLVTATATELNYTDVTTIGTAQASKALVVDANKDIGSIRNVRTIGNFGINTTSADKQAEINSSTGDCLRLTYNDNNGSAVNYSDFLVSNTGDLTLTPSGANLNISSALAVTGATTLSSTLGVTGASTLSSTLGVTGATTLSSTLGVTGATTLSSTLDVTGVINFNNVTDATSYTSGGCLTIDGGAAIAKKLFVGTDLDVGGNSVFTGTMGVTGATSLSSTLGVTGATTLSSTLGVTGATTLSSTLGVTGATTLSSTLGVTGATTLSSTLGVTGATTLSNTTDATSSTVGGSLTVAGGAGIAKKLFVGTDFAVGGNSTLTGTLGVTGATTLSSTLGVTGASTLSSTLGVSGATTLSSTLDVTGVTNLNNTTDATSSTAGGSLTIDGGAGIAKKLFVGTDLAIGGNSSLTGTLGVTGASTLSSTLGVSGATTLSSTLDVTGVTNLNNTTDATSSTAGGSLTIDGGAGIAKKLFVGTDLAIGGNSSLTGTLGVTGASTLSSTLGVTGATTLSSTLGVTGATTLSSTLDVTGAATFSSTLGITGALTLNNTTDATSSTVGGCLTVAGGAGIAKKLFVGTDFAVGGNSTLSGNLSITGPILSIPTGNTSARPATPQVGYIRYNSETSQFEGYGAGNAWGSLGGVSDVDQNTKILAEDGAGTNDNNLRFFNNGNESMRLTAASKLGVGTTAPSKQVEINATAGDVLRLTRNNNTGTATNYSDFSISSSGNLNILSSGLTTTIDETNNFDIVGHNGSTLGLKLNGTLVTSTATQLNYNNVTPGTAAATKALILDSSRNIANINSITTNNVNFTIDNATANNVGYPINLIRTTSGTPANGLGIGLDFFIENAANNNIEFGTIEVSADDITTGSEDGLLTVKLMNGGTSSAALTLTHTYLTVTELVETSDRRVKENIVSVNNEDSFNKIMDLNIVDYNFIADSEKKTHRGLIAQELAEVIPSAINISERNGIEDFHAVSSKELVGYLISSLQHMNTKFEELNSKYEELKNGMCRCNQ